MTRLEEVVEEMSSLFMSFVDEVLATEAIVTQPKVMGCMGRSVRKMWELVREVVGEEETGENLVQTSQPATPSIPPQIFTSPAITASFTHRLASASLNTAFILISSDASGGNVFRGKIREEMLTRIQWLLGPGKSEIHCVAQLPYGRYGQHVYTRNELSPSIESLTWPLPKSDGGGVTALTSFLSIEGVEKQLAALGSRFIDSETLEFTFPKYAPLLDFEAMSAQPESWSFVNFFCPEAAKTRSADVTMRLDVGRLISGLAKRTVCLMRGPGFRRDEIGYAIEEAVIGVC